VLLSGVPIPSLFVPLFDPPYLPKENLDQQIGILEKMTRSFLFFFQGGSCWIVLSPPDPIDNVPSLPLAVSQVALKRTLNHLPLLRPPLLQPGTS